MSGHQTPTCSKCGWDRSHVGHSDQGLYSFHPFEVADYPCPSCGGPTHDPTDECWCVDLGTCPYFAEDDGLCCFGCVDEPRCRTERPAAGWPSEGGLTVEEIRQF